MSRHAPFPNLCGVTVQLTAEHFDPTGEEGWHEHTWHITGFWPAAPLRDMREARRTLAYVVKELPIRDGKLPVSMWAAESIAAAILNGTHLDRRGEGNPKGQGVFGMIAVRVTRAEGFEAWIWA